MQFREFVFLLILALAPLLSQVFAGAGSANSFYDHNAESSTPFSTSLEKLQKQIKYNFSNVGLLRRAMTHASFSEENYRALSILGGNVIDTSVSLQALLINVDISSKDLNRLISEISKVESSCAADGMLLGLENVIRVSPKTNSSAPSVVCGAFRAMFGAIAVDTKKADFAGDVFWKVHSGQIGRAAAWYFGGHPFMGRNPCSMEPFKCMKFPT